jgi:hypothetical protein
MEARMKSIFSILLSVSMVVLPGVSTTSRSEEVTPLASINFYGGAERDINKNVGPLGGTELLGVAPLVGNFGFQGSLGWEGGNESFRTLVSGGPVYKYSSGMFGLFVQYEYKQTPLAHVSSGPPTGDLRSLQDRGGTRNNFIFLRGVWAHYFDTFDFVLSYVQPTQHIQHSSALQFKHNTCIQKKDLTMNELKANLRYYPTPNTELNGGFLVNSFAGPTRNESGTGVGGSFGASYRIIGPMVLNLVQGQFDSRSRYRVTSGVQFFWAPPAVEKTLKEERETTLAALATGTAGGAFSSGA